MKNRTKLLRTKRALKPSQLANLRPFAPGQSGNPGGKPFVKLHQRLSKITADELSETASDDLCVAAGVPVGSTHGVCVVHAMVRVAIGGSVDAARFLFTCSEASKVLNVHLHEAVSDERMNEIRAMLRSKVAEEAARLASLPAGETP